MRNVYYIFPLLSLITSLRPWFSWSLRYSLPQNFLVHRPLPSRSKPAMGNGGRFLPFSDMIGHGKRHHEAGDGDDHQNKVACYCSCRVRLACWPGTVVSICWLCPVATVSARWVGIEGRCRATLPKKWKEELTSHILLMQIYKILKF